MPVGAIVGGGCVSELAARGRRRLRRPFPDESYKEGARQFPVLVPTRPDDPPRAANRRAWEVLREVRQAVPVCLQRPRPDHPRRRPALLRPGARDTWTEPHHHQRRRPLPPRGQRRGPRRGGHRLRRRRTARPEETSPTNGFDRQPAPHPTNRPDHSWAARSSSSPPTSSATTLSAAPAAPSPARRSSTALAADGHRLPPGPQPEHGVHAGALDDDHRPVRADPRRRRQRRPASRRRAVGRRAPARHRGLPHRSDRQGPLPARLRPRPQVGGEPHGPRGFDRALPRLRPLELAMHGYLRQWHYDKWLERNGPQWCDAYYPLINDDQHGPQRRGRWRHRRPRGEAQSDPEGMYHTDWVADRTIAWLDSLDPDDDWFCWMSFPDPHHPWDPPVDEVRRRVDWHDLDLPAGPPRVDARRRSRSSHRSPTTGSTGTRDGSRTWRAAR